MSYYTSSGLCSNDPFLVRTPVTALSKIATLPCVLYLLLALQAHSPSFCLFCQGANLHHQVPLPCGFQLSLADRDPWQRMRGKEEVGMLIASCGVALGWLKAGWVITEEALSTRPSSSSLLAQGQ